MVLFLDGYTLLCPEALIPIISNLCFKASFCKHFHSIWYSCSHVLCLDKRRVTGKAKKIVPRPPPVPYTHPSVLRSREPSNLSSPMRDEQSQVRTIMLLVPWIKVLVSIKSLSRQEKKERMPKTNAWVERIPNYVRHLHSWNIDTRSVQYFLL